MNGVFFEHEYWSQYFSFLEIGTDEIWFLAAWDGRFQLPIAFSLDDLCNWLTKNTLHYSSLIPAHQKNTIIPRLLLRWFHPSFLFVAARCCDRAFARVASKWWERRTPTRTCSGNDCTLRKGLTAGYRGFPKGQRQMNLKYNTVQHNRSNR